MPAGGRRVERGQSVLKAHLPDSQSENLSFQFIKRSRLIRIVESHEGRHLTSCLGFQTREEDTLCLPLVFVYACLNIWTTYTTHTDVHTSQHAHAHRCTHHTFIGTYTPCLWTYPHPHPHTPPKDSHISLTQGPLKEQKVHTSNKRVGYQSLLPLEKPTSIRGSVEVSLLDITP